MHTRRIGIAILSVIMLNCGEIAPVQADVGFAVFFGRALSRSSDVRLSQGPDTQLRFRKVEWYDRSFDTPLYYGLRVSYFSGPNDAHGAAIEFTHAKMYAHIEREAQVSGRRASQVVDTVEPLRQTFQNLALSHGYNYLTVNWLYRDTPTRDHGWYNTMLPYIGAGVGVALPHVEVTVADEHLDNYQLAGWVTQMILGTSLAGDANPLRAEYKYSQGWLRARLPRGSEVELNPGTHHLTFGVSAD